MTRSLLTHLLFDLLAYALAVICAVYFRRQASGRFVSPLPSKMNVAYFFVLTNGVIAGSVLFGSLNVYLAGQGPAIGKSILGAIVGGIIAVEWFKKIRAIEGSTGAALVPGLALGVFVGRWGCFFSGLTDYTHGIPSGALPGYDFGDGVPRHPVQLYEAFTMLVFFVVASVQLQRGSETWWRKGFYYFAIGYGAQRFVWEFLKPYPELLAGLNLFHILSLALIAYGLVMLGYERECRRARNVT